ncbi:hypothetical protein KIN20_034099 [Parelaphostrongylus tenuis]|uniref:Uncharacterized protein n=1 Tax=Parelaphostrongylus tenuis TaxID=148309 RepID=A0AAD5R9U5_PARTN|nr:hypothetical protein KIN20_034099 [Parelaphostrongylus tenuis]
MQDDNNDRCIIVGNTVKGICKMKAVRVGAMMCDKAVVVTAVNGTHLTVSGTLTTTNIIMANWSRTMWQSVVNRAVRMVALSPFESHFFSASAIVGGN